MKKKIGVFLVVLFSMIALGTAQTATITDADSSLTDTQVTYDFSGLPSNEDLVVESVGDDITEVASFTSSSAGTALVSWRHNPFEDGTAIVSDGWSYRVRNSDGSFSYQFEVAHGNMLLALDTFNDAEVNNEIWNFNNNGDGDCNFAENENTGVYYFEASSSINQGKSCEATSRISYTISDDEVVNFDLEHTGTGDTEGELRIVNNGVLTSVDVTNQAEYKAYIEDGTAYIERGGSVVASSSVSVNTFQPVLYVDNYDSGFENSRMDVYGFSVTPQVSKDAWSSPTTFDPATNNLVFGNILVNQPENVGLEFSNSSLEWSVTPPSTGSLLNYRNTGNGTLGSVAVDTKELLGGLTFNPLQPNNNTVFVVEENNSLSQEFIYEFLYERSDCSESAALTVGWTLYNETSGNQLSSSVYPSPFMSEGQCTFYREFTEEETLPAGEYRWTAQFTEGNIGVTRFYDMYFSIEEADNVPVSFELRDPQDGADVELSNGTYQFDYSVDAQDPGTLNLVIPQYDNSVRYSTSIPAGNTTQSVELQLDANATYNWYLTYTNSTTYQSGTNTFTALAETTDGGGDGDGDQDGNLVVNIWYSILEYFGITGTVADVFTASLLVMIVTVAATLVTDSVLIGVLAFNLGLTVTTIAGLLPGWMLFLQITLAGIAVAYLYQKVSSD